MKDCAAGACWLARKWRCVRLISWNEKCAKLTRPDSLEQCSVFDLMPYERKSTHSLSFFLCVGSCAECAHWTERFVLCGLQGSLSETVTQNEAHILTPFSNVDMNETISSHSHSARTQQSMFDLWGGGLLMCHSESIFITCVNIDTATPFVYSLMNT